MLLLELGYSQPDYSKESVQLECIGRETMHGSRRNSQRVKDATPDITYGKRMPSITQKSAINGTKVFEYFMVREDLKRDFGPEKA